jgi:hypothetical protein
MKEASLLLNWRHDKKEIILYITILIYNKLFV